MKAVEYIKETKAEMKHVSWPTRKQSINFTLLVIAISVVIALLLSVFDYIFSKGLEKTLETTNGSNVTLPISSEEVSAEFGAEDLDGTESTETEKSFNVNIDQ